MCQKIIVHESNNHRKTKEEEFGAHFIKIWCMQATEVNGTASN
jgi:hypothetical protein